MPFVVLLAALFLGALGGACGNGLNGHGYDVHGSRGEVTYEPLPRASAAEAGARVHGRATLSIVEVGLRMQGTIDLAPPAASISADRAGGQSDLVSERYMVVTVREIEHWAEWWNAREREVEILIRGHALLHGTPADPIAALAHPAVQASHSAEVIIWPGRIADGGTPERLHFTGTGRGRTLAEDAGPDNLLAYDLDATLTNERIARIEQLVVSSELERRRVAELSQLVAIQLDLLDGYRRERGRGFPHTYFEHTDEILRILGWHIGHRPWDEPALGRYRDALAELFVLLTNAREAARASKPGPKSAGQHLIDVFMVLPHTAGTVVGGVVETGRMVRDLGTYTTAVDHIERTATTESTRQAAQTVYAYIDTLDQPADFLAALERTLTVAHHFQADQVAELCKQAVRAADPIGYLDDIRWLATLAPDARVELARLVTANRAPDLTWLRAADLDPRDLEHLALDTTTNWAVLQRRSQRAEDLPKEVRAVVGKRVDELQSPPPGTEFWTPVQGRKQLRWKKGNATGRPSLSLDSHGRIVVGGADDLNRAALSHNMRKTTSKLEDHQDHHIVPIELARDHDLFRAARTRGEPRWDPNHPDNGIQLPASTAARDKTIKSQGLPIHNGNHAGYSKLVERLAEEHKARLEVRYGTLDKVPAEELTLAAKEVEDQARAMIETWITEQGDRLQ